METKATPPLQKKELYLSVKALASQMRLLVLRPLFSTNGPKQNKFARTHKYFEVTSGEERKMRTRSKEKDTSRPAVPSSSQSSRGRRYLAIEPAWLLSS